MVRAARNARELSQAALGELVGLSQTEIHKIESGRLTANLDHALRLQFVLGLPPHARGLALIEASATHHHMTPEVILTAMQEALDNDARDATQPDGAAVATLHDELPENA